MKTIWKFPLSEVVSLTFGLEMPLGADVVHVGVQNGEIVLWARVDTELEIVTRYFVIIETGDPEPHGAYVGTVQIEQYVWHVFEPYGG